MASDIFRNLIEQKIDVFANTFGDSANILFKRIYMQHMMMKEKY